MAKLEFPANPTTGQQYTGTNGVIYQWDSAKWQTRIVQSYVNTGANPGTTPPANPSPGTFWWDSEAGQLYIWYTDANSSQWMQAAVLGTTYDSQGNVVTSARCLLRTWQVVHTTCLLDLKVQQLMIRLFKYWIFQFNLNLDRT